MHTPENALLTDLYFYTYFINMYVCISSYLIATVKIKETSFKMESGSPERGLSATALPLSATCSHLQTSAGRSVPYIYKLQEVYTFLLEEERFSLGLATVQPIRKHHI